jgi:hypothetical protein
MPADVDPSDHTVRLARFERSKVPKPGVMI